jgi:NADH-quinone oxidoreductase subunit A
MAWFAAATLRESAEARRTPVVEALLSISIFIAVGVAFVFGNLALGALLRPKAPSPEKSAAYECGEIPMGANWVQFDLRFYIIALLYLIFDVEVALFYPWAVVYGNAAKGAERLGISLFQYRQAALVDMLLFFGLLLLGFAYLWRFGYLDWVKSRKTEMTAATAKPAGETPAAIPTTAVVA